MKNWKNNIKENTNKIDEEMKQSIINEFIKYMKGVNKNENSRTNEKSRN